MACWIFSMTGELKDFKERVLDESWPIYQRTRHRMLLKKNDHVVFYLAGEGNKKLLGYATLSSNAKKDDSTEEDFFVKLANIELFKKPIMIKEILHSLDFIQNKGNWGIYFQGGVSKLPNTDYKKILNMDK